MIKAYLHLLYAFLSIVFGVPFMVLGWIVAEAYMAARIGFRACMSYNNGTLIANMQKILGG